MIFCNEQPLQRVTSEFCNGQLLQRVTSVFCNEQRVILQRVTSNEWKVTPPIPPLVNLNDQFWSCFQKNGALFAPKYDIQTILFFDHFFRKTVHFSWKFKCHFHHYSSAFDSILLENLIIIFIINLQFFNLSFSF